MTLHKDKGNALTFSIKGIQSFALSILLPLFQLSSSRIRSPGWLVGWLVRCNTLQRYWNLLENRTNQEKYTTLIFTGQNISLLHVYYNIHDTCNKIFYFEVVFTLQFRYVATGIEFLFGKFRLLCHYKEAILLRWKFSTHWMTLYYVEIIIIIILY